MSATWKRERPLREGKSLDETAPYARPPGPHARRHGPSGYAEYTRYKVWLRDEFQFRCVYCLHREKWEKDGWRAFQIDHIVPQSVDDTKINLYENLLYAFASCNRWKSTLDLPDPCIEAYERHYVFEADGTVTALTEVGRDYVDALRPSLKTAPSLPCTEPSLCHFRANNRKERHWNGTTAILGSNPPLHGTDQRLGVSFDQQDGSAVGGWTEYGVIGAYAHTARHAVKCAEWCRTQDVAWRSSPRTGRAGFRLR